MPSAVPLLVLLVSALSAGAADGEPQGLPTPGAPTSAFVQGPGVEHAPGAQGPGLPWFDEVRDQRRALAELRRARRDAEQDARLDEFLRRRQERREQIEQERWLFMNYGPWFEPLAPPPASPAKQASPKMAEPPPPGWDNRWYFNGW